MRAMWSVVRAVSLLSSLLAPGNEAAELPPRFDFRWQAPEGCPRRDAVLAEAERLLGQPPERASKGVVEIEAVVQQLPDASFRLELRSQPATTPRNVVAGSCEELGHAAALLIALSIDPSRQRASDAAQAKLTAAEPAPAAGLPTPSASAATPPTRRSKLPVHLVRIRRSARSTPAWNLQLGAAMALWAGRLPGVAPGVVVQGGGARRAFGVLAELGYFPRRPATLPESDAGGDFWMASFGSHAAYAILEHALRVELFAGLELQLVRGTGAGVRNPQTADVVLVGAQAGSRAALRLSTAWALFFQGSLSVLAERPQFVLDDIGPVHRPAPLAGRLALGAEWRLP